MHSLCGHEEGRRFHTVSAFGFPAGKGSARGPNQRGGRRTWTLHGGGSARSPLDPGQRLACSRGPADHPCAHHRLAGRARPRSFSAGPSSVWRLPFLGRGSRLVPFSHRGLPHGARVGGRRAAGSPLRIPNDPGGTGSATSRPATKGEETYGRHSGSGSGGLARTSSRSGESNFSAAPCALALVLPPAQHVPKAILQVTATHSNPMKLRATAAPDAAAKLASRTSRSKREGCGAVGHRPGQKLVA